MTFEHLIKLVLRLIDQAGATEPHYTAIPTKNAIEITNTSKDIKYLWKINKDWNHITVNAAKENEQMLPESIEEFIFEHYYGYTKINSQLSWEYKIK